MRRSSSLRHRPSSGGESLFERLRETIVSWLERLGGERPQQALPLSRYRGPAGPVIPYHERRQLLRARRRQHSSYALAFVLVLLVLVVGIFYGLSWALGSISVGGGSSPTPTAGPLAIATPPASLATAPIPSPSPPTREAAPSPGPAAPPPNAAATPEPSPEPRTYIVKPGDTPAIIARQFGVSVEALMRANNITDPRALRVGQRLTIPEPSPTPTT